MLAPTTHLADKKHCRSVSWHILMTKSSYFVSSLSHIQTVWHTIDTIRWLNWLNTNYQIRHELSCCCCCSFRQGSSLLWTHMLRPFYNRPIMLTQEGRSLVNDVCKCVRDWRVREGWVGVSNFVSYLYCAPSRRGLLSGLGPIDWCLLFNVSQQTQQNLSLQPTSAWLAPWCC